MSSCKMGAISFKISFCKSSYEVSLDTCIVYGLPVGKYRKGYSIQYSLIIYDTITTCDKHTLWFPRQEQIYKLIK